VPGIVDPAIDTPAKMLDEAGIETRIDRGDNLIEICPHDG
jgi:hypothetical protein